MKLGPGYTCMLTIWTVLSIPAVTNSGLNTNRGNLYWNDETRDLSEFDTKSVCTVHN